MWNSCLTERTETHFLIPLSHCPKLPVNAEFNLNTHPLNISNSHNFPPKAITSIWSLQHFKKFCWGFVFHLWSIILSFILSPHSPKTPILHRTDFCLIEYATHHVWHSYYDHFFGQVILHPLNRAPNLYSLRKWPFLIYFNFLDLFYYFMCMNVLPTYMYVYHNHA